MKIKIFKPKDHNFNSKLNGLHFVEFIQNIPLVVDVRSAPKGATVVCFHPPRASIPFFPNLNVAKNNWIYYDDVPQSNKDYGCNLKSILQLIFKWTNFEIKHLQMNRAS